MIWLSVIGYEGRYEVSTVGGVRAINYKRSGQRRELRPSKDSHGYWMVTLYGNGPRKSAGVHQLVAAAFLGPKPDGFDVNHIDGKPTNNDASNLEYVTRSENMKHAFRLGLKQRKYGEANPSSRLTAAKVAQMRRMIADGMTQQNVADSLSVNRTTVQRVLRGKTWQSSQKVG